MKLSITSKMVEIEKSLNEVQGKCRTRLMSKDDLLALVNQVEKNLDSDELPKNRRIGVKALIGRGGQYCNAYTKKGAPMATIVTIEHGSAGWFVTEIERSYSEGNDYIEYTEEQKKYLIEKFTKKISFKRSI